MAKQLTKSQILGEIGEAAVRSRFLTMGFQFDGRSRLESGIDGIAEVMVDGQPLARMIAVQVKSRSHDKYVAEDESGFSYLLKKEDLEYWKPSNLPVIVVLYRQSDETFYWKHVTFGVSDDDRKLSFDKSQDVLDRTSADRLAALTVSKSGLGYFVPPLGGGEEALVNILPVKLPDEMFVSRTSLSAKAAAAVIQRSSADWRFDWVIRGSDFWSFHDPRTSVCREIVDLDQVEAIDTSLLAFHDEVDEQNQFRFLLKSALSRQVSKDLRWEKNEKLFFFKAKEKNTPRTFSYMASKHRAEAEVVNVTYSKTDPSRVSFVRHHAFIPRFELIGNEWVLVVNPTYYFTVDGFLPHSYPAALLAGKKRMDNSASLRGQVVMWHRFLSRGHQSEAELFQSEAIVDAPLKFGSPPIVSLATKVPDDAWGAPKKRTGEVHSEDQAGLFQ